MKSSEYHDTYTLYQIAIDIKLNNYKEIDIIVLKGHLILEMLLDESLGQTINPADLKALDLTFAKKILLLKTLAKDEILNDLFFMELKEINRLRNKLAHNILFENSHEDLNKWAKNVIERNPTDIKYRKTIRLNIIAAFYSITSRFVKYLKNEYPIEMQEIK